MKNFINLLRENLFKKKDFIKKDCFYLDRNWNLYLAVEIDKTLFNISYTKYPVRIYDIINNCTLWTDLNGVLAGCKPEDDCNLIKEIKGFELINYFNNLNRKV